MYTRLSDFESRNFLTLDSTHSNTVRLVFLNQEEYEISFTYKHYDVTPY